VGIGVVLGLLSRFLGPMLDARWWSWCGFVVRQQCRRCFLTTVWTERLYVNATKGQRESASFRRQERGSAGNTRQERAEVKVGQSLDAVIRLSLTKPFGGMPAVLAHGNSRQVINH
jgi:hypothetical protein